MRRWNAFLLILSMIVAGCASTGAPPSQTTYRPAADAQSPGDPLVPVPPADAHWTIYCMPIISADHVNIARRMRASLATATKLKDWYVLHNEDQSVLYYGYYRSINDPNDRAESERAQRDRGILDSLTDSQGSRPFQKAVFVPLEQVDPVAPPEWDLTNAKGYYTLQIQAYKDHPKRKEAAVQAVRDFRERGIEAYYYHGPTASTVCIGAWPIEAVRTDGDEIRAEDPQADLLVAPHLGEEQARELEKRTGKTVRRNTAKPVDPSLIAMMRQFPEHAVNYEVKHRRRVDPRTGKAKDSFDESFVVPIPPKDPSKGSGILGASAPPRSAPADRPRPDPDQDRPGAGRLKSIGD